jgi:hypothetical protein
MYVIYNHIVWLQKNVTQTIASTPPYTTSITASRATLAGNLTVSGQSNILCRYNSNIQYIPSTATINNNVNLVIYSGGISSSSATLTLPLIPLIGQEIRIVTGPLIVTPTLTLTTGSSTVLISQNGATPVQTLAFTSTTSYNIKVIYMGSYAGSTNYYWYVIQ